jgi:hypothetical protein
MLSGHSKEDDVPEGRIEYVSEPSRLGRIGDSILGLLAGLALFLAALPLLFWNEGRAVQLSRALEEGSGVVIAVPADGLDRDLNGRLIHVSGLAESGQTLRDPQFNLKARVIKLRRTVEMYQWQQAEGAGSNSGATHGDAAAGTVAYIRVWSQAPIDSDGFAHSQGHRNPGSMALRTREVTSRRVSLGDYLLSTAMVDRITAYRSFDLPVNLAVPSVPGLACRRTSSGYYCGDDADAPAVGDLRISFDQVPDMEVSVVGRQNGRTLAPYRTEAGETIEMLQLGTVTADQMIGQSASSGTGRIWALRWAGLLLLFLGLSLVLRPASVTADLLPFMGSLIAAGGGLVALLLAGVFALGTIAAAWLLHRPMLGIGFLAGAGGLAAGMVLLLRRAPADPTPAHRDESLIVPVAIAAPAAGSGSYRPAAPPASGYAVGGGAHPSAARTTAGSRPGAPATSPATKSAPGPDTVESLLTPVPPPEKKPARPPATRPTAPSRAVAAKAQSPTTARSAPRPAAPPASKTRSTAAKAQPAASQDIDWMVAGDRLFAAGKFDKAIAAFTRAIAADPQAGAYYGRGVTLLKTRQAQKAVADLKSAAKLGHDKARQLLTAKNIPWQ